MIDGGLDYYGILGISRQATLDDIQRAYRRSALKYHPFRYDGPLDRDYFYKVSEAYHVLSDSRTKSLYDQYGEKSMKAGVPLPPKPDEEIGRYETYTFHGDPYKVFREFFGVDNPFADFKLPNIDPEYKFCPIPPEKRALGPSRVIPFPLSLEEAFFGCKKVMDVEQTFYDEEFRRYYQANKQYHLEVPPGCEDGRLFIFKQESDQGRNIIPGDVTFVANMYPHEKYQLQGKNFVVKKSIPLAHSLMGCVVDVQTIDNKTLHVPLTNVIKPGERIVLPNEGMTSEDSEKRGDLVIQFDVEFPERFSLEQRKLLEEALLKKQNE